ncbi:hypothetical protein [Nitrosospira sp. NRS527]|uniref:hypothetical protein n=1 Tax=Nitrosospira sp. NRS527 TaxID=155925 RepID=UPI001BCBCDF3|nr:hypothetical protein [Nitrosospira sp. NRS527]
MNLRLFNVASSSIRFFHQEKAHFVSVWHFYPLTLSIPLRQSIVLPVARREQFFEYYPAEFVAGNPGRQMSYKSF